MLSMCNIGFYVFHNAFNMGGRNKKPTYGMWSNYYNKGTSSYAEKMKRVYGFGYHIKTNFVMCHHGL